MPITADSPFRGVVRITRNRFIEVLGASANPRVLEERDPDQYWEQCVADEIDPLFILAKFNHESSMGKAGVAVTTHSWGNTRSPDFGAKSVSEVPGRSGTFPVWKDWLDGLKSTTGRLNATNWVYHDRTKIREIYDHPSGQVWAPAGDLNNPAGYLRAMLDFMNRWQNITEETPGMPLQLKQCIIPTGRNNRPGLRLVPKYITVHETANTSHGAGAAAHCNYIRSDGAASRPASWHATVDDHEAYQHLPFNEVAWHAGDGTNGVGNRQSLAIELCVNSDSDWEQAKRNAAGIISTWMDEYDIPLANVVQHGHWNKNTSCPARMRAGDWPGFLAMLKPVEQPEPNPNLRHFPVTDKWVMLGFLSMWTELELFDPNLPLRVLGYPLTNEGDATLKDGSTIRIQYFERAVLKWNPGTPDPFDITCAQRSEVEQVVAFDEATVNEATA